MTPAPHIQGKTMNKHLDKVWPKMLQNKANSTVLGAIFLFMLLPCMWGLGLRKDAPIMKSKGFQWYEGIRSAPSVAAEIKMPSFQNHYTYEITIFDLFRGLQLQLSGGSSNYFSLQLQFPYSSNKDTVTGNNSPQWFSVTFCNYSFAKTCAVRPVLHWWQGSCGQQTRANIQWAIRQMFVQENYLQLLDEKLKARAPATPRTRYLGQSAHAESTNGVFS